MHLAGTAGLSIGIYQHGERVYQNYGLRDTEKEKLVTNKTIFPICSLTKLFTSIAISHVLKEKGFTWKSPAKDMLMLDPGMEYKDPDLWKDTTIEQLLSHRSGFPNPDHYRGCSKSMLIDKKDSLKFVADLSLTKRSHDEVYSYNNMGYKIAGLIVDQQLGSWSNWLTNTIFKPLGMTRTFAMRPDAAVQNVSKRYNVTREDSRPVAYEINPPADEDNSFAGGSGGMFSCANDLLEAYVGLMHTFDLPGISPTVSSTADVFKSLIDVKPLFTKQTPIYGGDGDYCLGLVRLQTPGRMGYISNNPKLLNGKTMPVVGTLNDNFGEEIYYHQGRGAGAQAAMAIIPRKDISIVVLSNTQGLNDCADWVLQLVIEKLFNHLENKDDYSHRMKLAEESATNNIRILHPQLERDVTGGKDRDAAIPSPQDGGPALDLESYEGTYINKGGYYKIVVRLDRDDQQLFWSKQGDPEEEFRLYHKSGDTFHWLGPRNDMVKRGLLIDKPAKFWDIKFVVEGEMVTKIIWVHDAMNPDGEAFYKTPEN
jgi:CubicO group peptidase (beta-lactamase class C family)